MTRIGLRTILPAIGLAVSAVPAFADAIDGNWCNSGDGRRFTIRGPDIVTPGGAAMQGNYSRHYFSYVAPPVEKGGGGTIYMTLMGENAVQLRYGDQAASDVENWVRCAPSISLLNAATRS